MKFSKSDLYFGTIFVGITVVLITLSTTIFKEQMRFETFWYSVGYLVFIEALFFLKPIAVEHITKKSGGFWAVIFTLNYFYIIIGLVILVISNIASKGSGVLVPTSTIGWTLVFAFFSGIYFKVTNAEARENETNDKYDNQMLSFKISLGESLSSIKRYSSKFSNDKIGVLTEITIIEKLIASIGSSHSDSRQEKIDAEINSICNDMTKAIQEERGAEYFQECLEVIKEKMRIREKILRR